MATNASGPTLAGGEQPIVSDGYLLTYYPDVQNNALQREGKPPVFYYVPNQLRLARKDGPDSGDYILSLIRFSGVQSADTHVGVEGTREVAGGVLSFAVTGAPPEQVLRQSQQQIIERFRGVQHYFWGIRSNVAPIFSPAPIVANVTTVSNVSPLADGSVPALAPGGPGGPTIVRTFSPSSSIAQQRTVPANRDRSADSNLNPWFWNMQGEGNGSINLTGISSYSALLGAYPTAIIWDAFHGVASPIFVNHAIKIKMWAPLVEITLRGNWDRVFSHFSAAASGRYLWASADVKVEFNNMRMSGDIEVEVKVDPTIPGGEIIQENINKKTDLVFEKFMAAAQKVIFEPPQPDVKAAEASSGFGLWGAGLALNYRRDQTSLDLYYHEKQEMAYLQDSLLQGTLSGLHDELANNPAARKKYFISVSLDDWPRKIGRVFKPVVNWPKPEQNWVGDPVAFASVQVAYPNQEGALLPAGHAFQKTDPADANWRIGFSQKALADVADPPAGWTPDKTFIKRKIHLLEPPDADEYPFVRVQIDENVISIDPEPNGTLLNDITVEVRADSAGKLRVGPIALNVELENDKQYVEVIMEATEPNGQPQSRGPVRFNWNYANQNEPRFWTIYTGNPTFRPFYRYKVRVIVKGSIFTKGMEWEGPWELSNSNGPLMVRVPTPDDPGVVTRALPFGLLNSRMPQPTNGKGAVQAPPATAQANGERAAAPALVVSGWRIDADAGQPAAGTGSAAPPPSSRTTGNGRPATAGHEDGARQPAQEAEIAGWRVDTDGTS